MKNISWRVVVIIAVIGAAIIYVLPTFKPGILHDKKINLGLDLQGGMHLVLEVDTDKAVEGRIERLTHEIRDLLKKKRVRYRAVERVEGTNILIKINGDKNIETSIAVSVAQTAIQSDVEVIITPTTSGNTARLISKYRPNTKIVALTPSARIARSLALHSGVEARVFNIETDTETLINESIQLAKDEYDCVKGCRIIITGGFPIGSPTNFLRIEDIK